MYGKVDRVCLCTTIVRVQDAFNTTRKHPLAEVYDVAQVGA